MLSFAGDFTLYCAKKSLHKVGRATSDTLGNIADAPEMKGLSLSLQKQLQCSSHIDLQPDIPAVAWNATVTQARLLGVIIDHKLSWRKHINHHKIVRKIGALGLSHRSSHQLTQQLAVSFSFKLFSPTLSMPPQCLCQPC